MFVLAASSFVASPSFTALLAGFAAVGSVTAFYSAYAAFLSWWYGETPADMANAAVVGLAYSFPIGAIVGLLAYSDAL